MQNVYRFVLAGNPNSGKTTFYNSCTGEKRRVSNRPGVTVDTAEGIFNIDGKSIELFDLPGIYSADNKTAEEKLASDFLQNEKYDLIINIVDTVCLERSLFLTTQLTEMSSNVIVILNMADAAEKKGIKVDCRLLSRMLGAPVIILSAKNQREVKHFIEEACKYPQDYTFNNTGRKTNFNDPGERYLFIGDVIKKCTEVSKGKSIDPDKVFTHKFFGLPLFFLILSFIFCGTYYFGGLFSELISHYIDVVKNIVSLFLRSIHVHETLISLVTDGCISGVGSVVSFIPQIFLLFTFLALLEDTGYMARASYLAGGFMSKIGLSGKAFVPLVLGFGCTVPAVLSCRTLETKAEHRKTLKILPFIPCSARLPLFMLLMQTYFGKYAAMGMIIIYFTGIAAAILIGKLSDILEKCFKIKGKHKTADSSAIIELPRYSVPSGSAVLLYAGQKTGDFLKRAGSVIFISSVIIWIILNIGPSGYTSDSSKSFGGIISEYIAVVLRPCGLGFWQIAMALAAGIAAKELTVSCMFMIFSKSALSIHMSLAQIGFGIANAAAMIVFVLLYVPCAASISAVKSELNEKWVVLRVFFRHILAAYIAAFLVYRLMLVIL